jgi:hypothetical protein
MYKKDISYGETRGYIMSCGSYMNNFVETTKNGTCAKRHL